MTTVYDVPSKDLIDAIARKLHKDKTIIIPEANTYSKTGVNKENPPQNKNWWYIRCASILRKIYISNIIGIEHLRAFYGGNKDRGSKPNRTHSGSGTIIRRAVQQLEKAGYLTKVKGKGRMLTPKGKSFMDNTSNEVSNDIKDQYVELKNID
jgi:small subunit ribosomal protein S19e